MKSLYLSIFLFASFIICKAQNSSEESSGINSPSRKTAKSYKTDALTSHSTERNVAKLDEGYTAFAGGEYVIKDYLVKGEYSLIEVTHGMSIAATGYAMDSQRYRRTPEKSYYIQKGEDKMAYKQVFVAPSRKTSLLEMSKSVLLDIFQGDQDVINLINGLKEVDRGELKKLVRLYNKKHGAA